jgi:hypothetical protein
MPAATGSPLIPWVDATAALLTADATLVALATGGIYAALPRNGRTTMPYVILGRREMNDQGGAMQLEGGKALLVIDVWSDHNGPSEAQAIQSRIRRVLQRQTLTIVGFAMIAGSMACEEELVFPDFDPDMPERTLFHGVQHWSAYLEEAAA